MCLRGACDGLGLPQGLHLIEGFVSRMVLFGSFDRPLWEVLSSYSPQDLTV